MSSVEITIRSIQHYLYCPHRWGLLEIDKVTLYGVPANKETWTSVSLKPRQLFDLD